jgi:hypothetical protein
MGLAGMLDRDPVGGPGARELLGLV